LLDQQKKTNTKQEIEMTEENTGVPVTPPGTVKSRYFLPSGEVVEFFLYGNTTPDQIDNLIENALLLDSTADEKGLIPANQTAGAAAVQKAAQSKIAGVREGNEVFHCVSIDILPQADGRSKVEFYGDTYGQPRDKFPTTSSLWTPDKLQELLAPYYEFLQDTFGKAGTFSVDFNVEYYFSKKTNQAGNPYKNVAKIHPIEGGAEPVVAEKPAPPEPQAPPVNAQQDIPF
jgi:hypothetical protein